MVENVPEKSTPHTIERSVTVNSVASEGKRLKDEICSLLETHGFDPKDVFAVDLALEEAIVNAMKHGNQYDPATSVQIAYRVNGQRVDVYIKDQGPGFDMEDLPDPLAPENLERPSGRGVMLIKHYMTHVEYSPKGNEVKMTRLRKEAHEAERERQEREQVQGVGDASRERASSLMMG